MTALDFSLLVVTTPKKIVEALTTILSKAEQHPKAASFAKARLNENMLPLSFQIHSVTNTICKSIAHVQGTKPPAFENDLNTIADMQARLKYTSEALGKADADLINRRQGELVVFDIGPGMTGQMRALDYTLGWVQPNVFFHLNMAYAILRMEGVDLGKQDYLNPFIKGDLTMLSGAGQ